jgi:hypothetical protein
MTRPRRKNRGRKSVPPSVTLEKRVANLIRDALRTHDGVLARLGPEPLPGSVAFGDIRNKQLQPDLTFAYYTASFQLRAANDHLRSLELLLRHGPTLYGSQVITRACAEAAARSWWLLDPEIDARVRTGRALTERLYVGSQVAKTNRSTGRDVGTTGLDQLQDAAQRYGLKPSVNRRGRTHAFGEPRPTTSDLIDAILAGRGFKLGTAMFQLYSAMAHANAAALLDTYEKQRDAATGRVIAYWPKPRLDRVRSDAGLALTCWEHAFSRFAECHGWDDEAWLASRERLYEVMMDVSRQSRAAKKSAEEGGVLP